MHAQLTNGFCWGGKQPSMEMTSPKTCAELYVYAVLADPIHVGPDQRTYLRPTYL
jgi:hypothetical protein